MFRRSFIALSVLTALALPASAADDINTAAGTIRVNAGQIQMLLSGNTIKGVWGDSTYIQYYDPNGATVYIPDGGQASHGKWRVKEETDQYDSWWENTGWTPYSVVMTNEGYAWVNGDKLEPFEVLEGKQAQY